MAAYAPITYRKSEASTLFDIPFDYLSKKFVNVELVGEVLEYGVHYDFLDKTRIRFLTGQVPAGTAVRLSRTTDPSSRLVSWRDASVLKASDLELSQLQLLHIAEEVRILAEASMQPSLTGEWDAQGKRIIRLGAPLQDTDATTLQWVKDYFSNLLSGVSGNVNLASGVFYNGTSLADYLKSSVINTVATVEAVRTLNPSVYTKAFALSHSGFAGGGLYVLDTSDTTSPDNNGTTLIGVAGARWKLQSEVITIDNFGAAGDGSTNDRQAAVAMLQATNGALRLAAKEYLVGQLDITQYNALSIQGERRPERLAGAGKLTGGSILVGILYVEANVTRFSDFGVDNGSDRVAVPAGDCLVSNAKPGQIGVSGIIERVAALGKAEEGTFHGILLQGYDSHSITDCFVAELQFGVVDKSRNGAVSNIVSEAIRTATVYLKGDLPEDAGWVLDGSCGNVKVYGVRSTCSEGNIESAAVYCHSSTANCTDIHITAISQLGGMTPLRIQGIGTLGGITASGIVAVDVSSESAQYGFFVDGYTYDWQLSLLKAVNPKTGYAALIGSNSIGWILMGVHTLISDPSITGRICVGAYGLGSWDNISARNPYGVMSIDMTPGTGATIGTGSISGDVRISLSTELVGINGAKDSAPRARCDLLPGKILKLSGRFDLRDLTNAAFCNLAPTGKQAVFQVVALTKTGSWTPQVVRLNDFQLTLEQVTISSIAEVDLNGITIKL